MSSNSELQRKPYRTVGCITSRTYYLSAMTVTFQSEFHKSKVLISVSREMRVYNPELPGVK